MLQAVYPTTGQGQPQIDALLRMPKVQHLVALSKTSIYKGVAEGTFPQPVRLTERSVAWRSSDIAKWINERSQGVA